MSELVLDIRSLGADAGWQAMWSVDGQTVGAPVTVDDAGAGAVDGLSRRFLEIFEEAGRAHRRPRAEPERLRAIGRDLFAQWARPVWADVEGALAATGNELLIRSGAREVLNLPWELMELTDGLAVGCDAAWSLRRRPVARSPRTTDRGLTERRDVDELVNDVFRGSGMRCVCLNGGRTPQAATPCSPSRRRPACTSRRISDDPVPSPLLPRGPPTASMLTTSKSPRVSTRSALAGWVQPEQTGKSGCVSRVSSLRFDGPSDA